jgi:thioredoxin 1
MFNPMASFESHINGTRPVVVDFFAEWCAPCKLMAPVLEEIKDAVCDRATVLKMDIDKNPSYATSYNIYAVPTLVIFREGHVVWRKSGIVPAHEILQHLALAMAD